MMLNRFKEDTVFIQDLESLMKDRLKGKIVKQDITPLTQFGENFGSEMLRVEVIVEEDGKEKVIHAVAKLIPPTEMQLEIFNTQVTFKNEMGFYSEIVPTLQEFQRENGIEPVMDYFPELYGARTSLKPDATAVDNDAVILMENLKINGYENLDRTKGYDLDSAKKVLRILAEFQATALALRKKKPEVFEARVSPYLSPWNSDNIPPTDMDPILSQNPSTVSLIPKVRKLLKKKWIRKIREPWATIVHQDLWVNNIMVKETNGDIESLKLVDFQITDLGSPLTDVLFFLFSSVQLPVLQFYFEKLLQYYYKEFVRVLGDFKINTKEFTYESFQEEVQSQGPYQTFHSLFMMFVIFGAKGLPNMPGKVPTWNPTGHVDVSNEGDVGPPSNGHGGPPSNGVSNKDPASKKPENGAPRKPQDEPPFKYTSEMKQKVWFVVEEAAKRNWI